LLVVGHAAQLVRKNEPVVRAQGYVSLQPVPQGREFRVAVLAEIAPGYHINADKPLEEYLIPTELRAHPPAGMRVVEAVYPKASLKQFAFSPEKLAVYDGTILLGLRLATTGKAPLGEVTLPLELRYQACNDKLCLPPTTLPLQVRILVASSGTLGKSLHPEIFSKLSFRRKSQ
jgi:thiol:disulfide interchange protein DsbD